MQDSFISFPDFMPSLSRYAERQNMYCTGCLEMIPENSKSCNFCGISISSPSSNEWKSPTTEIKSVNLMEQLIYEIEAAVTATSTFDSNQVIQTALEAIYRGGSYDRVLLGLVTPDRRAISGRLRLGTDIDGTTNLVYMRLQEKTDPLIRMLLSGQDIFITRPMIHQFPANKILKGLNPECFGLFPIFIKNVLAGAIYFDRIEPKPLDPLETLPTISRLRELIAQALARSRSANSSGPLFKRTQDSLRWDWIEKQSPGFSNLIL
jgi:hypothetical protein